MNYGPFAVTHCQKCSNELTYAEYRAKAWYCEPCRKARAAYQCWQFCSDRNPERAAVHMANFVRWRDLARRLGA